MSASSYGSTTKVGPEGLPNAHVPSLPVVWKIQSIATAALPIASAEVMPGDARPGDEGPSGRDVRLVVDHLLG